MTGYWFLVLTCTLLSLLDFFRAGRSYENVVLAMIVSAMILLAGKLMPAKSRKLKR